MPTPRKSAATAIPAEAQAEVDKLADELETIEKTEDQVVKYSEKVESLRWSAAERSRHLIRDLKVSPQALAKELDVTPAYVRQFATVAELYGEDDYRLSVDGEERSFNDHLELAKLAADKRDAVAKYAEDYGCSIKTARIKVAEKAKAKVAKGEGADDESASKSSKGSISKDSSGPSLKLSGKGGLEKLNEEARTLVGFAAEIASSLNSAIDQGARFTEEEAAELVAIAESLAETAGRSTAEAPAAEAAPKATKTRKVRRTKAEAA